MCILYIVHCTLHTHFTMYIYMYIIVLFILVFPSPTQFTTLIYVHIIQIHNTLYFVHCVDCTLHIVYIVQYTFKCTALYYLFQFSVPQPRSVRQRPFSSHQRPPPFRINTKEIIIIKKHSLYIFIKYLNILVHT